MATKTTLEITRLASPAGITVKVYKVLQNKVLDFKSGPSRRASFSEHFRSASSFLLNSDYSTLPMCS